MLLLPLVDVSGQELGAKVDRPDGSEERLQMNAPSGLHVGERLVSIDPIIAEKVFGQFLDAYLFYLGPEGLAAFDLRHTLPQEAGCLHRIGGSAGLAEGLTSKVILDPEIPATGILIDRALAALAWQWIASLTLSGAYWIASPAWALQGWKWPFFATFTLPVLVFALILLEAQGTRRQLQVQEGAIN